MLLFKYKAVWLVPLNYILKKVLFPLTCLTNKSFQPKLCYRGDCLKALLPICRNNNQAQNCNLNFILCNVIIHVWYACPYNALKFLVLKIFWF